MWHIRIQGAMERELEQRKNRPNTMEQNVRRTKRKHSQRRPQVKAKVVTPWYIQRALWTQGEPKDPPEISNDPLTSLETRKNVLDRLVMKQKLRKRLHTQTTLPSFLVRRW